MRTRNICSLLAACVALVGTPSSVGAAVLPGDVPDFVDSNGALVGKYLGPRSVAVHTSDGDVAILEFGDALTAPGDGPWPETTLWYATNDCTGTAYVDQSALLDAVPSVSGMSYSIVRNAQIARGPNTPIQLTPLSRQVPTNSACGVTTFSERTVVAVQIVGSVPDAFPFHLEFGASPAPAIPSLAVSAVGVALLAVGAVWSERRRGARG